MKFALPLAIILAATPAFAQAPAPYDPAETAANDTAKGEATERMLLDEMTQHRNWYATAIAKNQLLQQEKAKVLALQKQLDAAVASAKPAVSP